MAILDTLLEITLYSSIIAVVTLLLKKLLSRRMSPWLHYAVWFVLIVRLMLPVTVESGFHVFTVPVQTQIQAAVVPQAPITANVSESAHDTNNGNQPQPISEYEPTESTVSPVSSPASVTVKPLSTENVLLTVWLFGAGLSLLYITLLYGTLCRRVRRNSAEPSERLLKLFDEVKTEMNINAHLKLVCQYEYGTPALLLPRTVLMPVDTLIAMDDEQIRFALRHELMHYRRGDHIACLLISLLNAVYWFNPLVWLSFRQMRADMEIACDGAVVKALDVPQKSRYASLIVGLFAQTERRQLVLGMAQGNAKKIAEQRVRGIFKEAKSHGSVKCISAFAVVLLLVTCFTTACQPTPQKAEVVGKDQSVMVEAAQGTEGGLRMSEMTAPETYSFSAEGADGALTVTADAVPVILPDAKKLPVADVSPGEFSQESVSRMLTYFFNDKPLYNADNNRVLTKDEIEAAILENQQMIADGTYENDSDKKALEECIQDLQKEYESAPETKAPPVLSDGKMAYDKIFNANAISVYTQDEATGASTAIFTCYNRTKDTVKPQVSAEINNEVNSGLYYCLDMNQEYGCYVDYRMDGALAVDENTAIPDDAKNYLGMTLAEAEAQVEDFFITAGLDNLNCGAAYVIKAYKMTNTGEFNKDDVVDYAYKLFYTPVVDDTPILPLGEIVYEVDEIYGSTWVYDSIEVNINQKGILYLNWGSLYAVDDMTIEDAAMISFGEAADIFENKAVAYFDTQAQTFSTENLEVDIDSIRLGLLRIKKQDSGTEKEGLYVPVWAFYGNTYSSSNYLGEEISCINGAFDCPQGPNIVLAVNAIDGSLINISKGY